MAREKTKATKKTAEQPSLRSAWKVVQRQQRGLLLAMGILAVMSLVLLVVTLVNLRPQNMQIYIGYSDIDSYQKGSWVNMLTFAVLAVVFGLLHNLLALKVFQKYGKDSALVVVFATMLLVVGAMVMLLRVLGAHG